MVAKINVVHVIKTKLQLHLSNAMVIDVSNLDVLVADFCRDVDEEVTVRC